jgi:hypothetical protein
MPPVLRAWGLSADMITERGELLEVGDTIRFQDEAGDTGSFSLFVPVGEPYFDTDVLAIGDVVRIDVDTTPACAFEVERIRYEQIGDGELGWTLTGPGTLAKWANAVVYPPLGVGRALFSDNRVWNFAAPELDDSLWDLAVVTEKACVGTNFGLPELFIDPDAYWIWDRLVDGGIGEVGSVYAPAGDCYFRTTFEKVAYGWVEMWAAADDSFEAWVDGVQVLTDPGYYRGNVRRAKFALDAGEHNVSIRGTNQNAAKAGILNTVVEVDAAGLYGDVICRTDATWKVLAYPDDPPGFEPTRTLRILLAEAVARGGLAGMAVDFDDTEDSDGATVATVPEFTVPIGTSLYSVIRQMSDEGHLDFRMDASTLTLHAWVKGTAGGDVPSVSFGLPAGDAETDNVRRLVHEVTQVGEVTAP